MILDTAINFILFYYFSRPVNNGAISMKNGISLVQLM